MPFPFLLACEPAKCRNVSGNKDVIFKDECLSLQSLSSKASSPNCSAARVSTSRRIPMGASRAPQRTPAPSVRGEPAAGWEVGSRGQEMTSCRLFRLCCLQSVLLNPKGRVELVWGGDSDGSEALGSDVCSLSPSPLQFDSRGAPCGHHPECQAGPLHGHECRGAIVQLGKIMRLSDLGTPSA